MSSPEDLFRGLSKDTKIRNFGGYVALVNKQTGTGPHFSSEIRRRVHQKLACNVAVTGEAGIGKSYMAIFLAMLTDKNFTVDQIVFQYSDFMEQLRTLKMGQPIVFDEPSYAMSKRDWYQQLNKALMKTLESMRFKVHPLFLPVINLNLLDKTVRSYLLQFVVYLHRRGEGTAYQVHASQWQSKLYRSQFCNLRFGIFGECGVPTCLGCGRLKTCDELRAQYERKKAALQDLRYERAQDEAAVTESKEFTMRQLVGLANDIRVQFWDEEKETINIIRLIVAMEREYSLRVSQFRAQQIREHLLLTHPEDYGN